MQKIPYAIAILLIMNFVYGIPLLPFYAEFTENDWTDWTVVDVSPYASGPSNWYAWDNVLRQTSNIYTTEAEFVVYSGTYIWAGDCLWRDYTLMLRYKSTDDDGIGFIVRYQNDANYYRFLIVQDPANGGPFRRIEKKVGGIFTTLAQNTSAFSYSSDYSWVNFVAFGESLIVYLDGVRFLAATDYDLSCGGVGISSYANTGIYVDDILVAESKITEARYITVVSGPYLQMPTTTSMTVCFELNLPSMASVRYGLTPDCPNVVYSSTSQMRHAVQISGLLPNTRYFYKIVTPDTTIGDERFWFRTKGAESAFKICIWSDNQTQHRQHFAVTHAMARESCDIAISSGDVCSDGSDYTRWQREYFCPAKEALRYMPSFVAIGNHEGDAHWFYDYVVQPGNEHYFAFSWGPARIIIMDTNYPYLPLTPQYIWLFDELTSTEYATATWRFVFHHHPPYCEGWDSPEYNGEANVRTYLVPLYEEYDVTAVISGHAHDYERGYKNGVLYFVTGGGGGYLDSWRQDWEYITVYMNIHQYMTIDVSPSRLFIACHDTTGLIVDSLTVFALDVESDMVSMPDMEIEAFPNPSNSSVEFRGFAPERGNLCIFDIHGSHVATFSIDEGGFSIIWESDVPTGAYIFSLRAGSKSKNGKVLVVR